MEKEYTIKHATDASNSVKKFRPNRRKVSEKEREVLAAISKKFKERRDERRAKQEVGDATDR